MKTYYYCSNCAAYVENYCATDVEIGNDPAVTWPKDHPCCLQAVTMEEVVKAYSTSRLTEHCGRQTERCEDFRISLTN